MRIIFGILLLFCFMSCSPNHKPESNTMSRAIFFKDEITAFNFTLNDSVELIYSWVQSYDTSFVLSISKNGADFKCSYLYYPPTYYLDFSEWMDLKVFLYKGVTLYISKSAWLQILNNLKEEYKFLQKRTNNYATETLHPPLVKYCFDTLQISNKDYGNIFFEKIYDVLNKNLIQKGLSYYPVINGRIP